MRNKTFYPLALMLLLSSCFGPNIDDVRELAEKKYEFDVMTSQSERLRFNNLMINKAVDSWRDMQKQAEALQAENRINDLNKDMMYFEKRYADKHGKEKLNELQKAAWVYETSSMY